MFQFVRIRTVFNIKFVETGLQEIFAFCLRGLI